MPQMAPMWWTTLFIFFITCMIMIIIKSYFMYIYKINKNSTKVMNSTNFIWKW